MHVRRVQNVPSVAQTRVLQERSLRISVVALHITGLSYEYIIAKFSSAPARPVGFSNVIPTSAESHRQWLQYRKKGGSPIVLITKDDARPSSVSGGSDGTTVNVFLQFGHMKQFRAQLCFPCDQLVRVHHVQRLTGSSQHEHSR